MVECAEAARLPDDQKHSIDETIIVHAISSAAQIDYRIGQRVRQYPHKLLLMALAPKDEPFETRAIMAEELLAADPETLEVNALKIRIIYEEDLKRCAGHGAH